MANPFEQYNARNKTEYKNLDTNKQIKLEAEDKEIEKNEKIHQLLCLIDEQKLCELQTKHKFFNAYELGITEREINDSYELIKSMVLKGDFYQNINGSNEKNLGGVSISLHTWFICKLPHSKEEFTKHKAEAQRTVEILKIMEEIKNPNLKYFSNGGEIATEIAEVVPLNQDVNVEFVISRKNRDEIIKSEFKRNIPALEDNQYNISILLLDNNGQVIHDFDNDLQNNSVISPGSGYRGGLSGITIPATDGKLVEKFSTDGIVCIAHEIGHNNQYHDEKFRQTYYKRKGRYPEDFSTDRKDPISERNAWAYGLQLLRNIEKETEKKILPEFSIISEEIKKHLMTYNAEYSKKV